MDKQLLLTDWGIACHVRIPMPTFLLFLFSLDFIVVLHSDDMSWVAIFSAHVLYERSAGSNPPLCHDPMALLIQTFWIQITN